VDIAHSTSRRCLWTLTETYLGDIHPLIILSINLFWVSGE
jgi:hypothetical protein